MGISSWMAATSTTCQASSHLLVPLRGHTGELTASMCMCRMHACAVLDTHVHRWVGCLHHQLSLIPVDFKHAGKRQGHLQLKIPHTQKRANTSRQLCWLHRRLRSHKPGIHTVHLHTKFGPLPDFINKVLLAHSHSQSFTFCLWLCL